MDTVVREFDEQRSVFLALEPEFGASYEQYRRRVEIAERRANELQRAEERRERARGIERRRCPSAWRAGRCRRWWNTS
ncbi:hypothetical protein A7D16_03310 [Xanthomonas nasturtii]|nr:hypothetical protein A7D16_03310 [Xanthomonas nasturtii]